MNMQQPELDVRGREPLRPQPQRARREFICESMI
jgi:hypothetical protein